jgi:hypothetical protein
MLVVRNISEKKKKFLLFYIDLFWWHINGKLDIWNKDNKDFFVYSKSEYTTKIGPCVRPSDQPFIQ